MKGRIYKITNIINNKIYIGKTYDTIERRFSQHKSDSKREKCQNRPLYRAFNKYGTKNFYIELIEEYEEVLLEEMEIQFIQEYDSYSNGYNATLGGEGTRYFEYSDEEVIKIYDKLQYINKTAEYFKCSVDTIVKILKSNNTKIINHNFKGTPIRTIHNGIVIEFDSITEAAKWILLNCETTCKDIQMIRRSISRAVNGTRKTYLKKV